MTLKLQPTTFSILLFIITFFNVIVEVKNCVLHRTPLLHEVPKSINGLGVDHY